MKIFELIRQLSKSIDSHERDYSDEYQHGYRDCISDMEEKIKDHVEVSITQSD